ncbi:WD-repeat protein [Pochonia chlamydosporia 170]|uniref:WD-repeat protein n=1 Tax=Pochonia chlamydosporia 170 TaxID=1380566 RepID=A0A179FF26_METCM|nr:WD-repeat protein [Pochonia chlamydosporia 170]OAQ64205.2 WD-repeat protein [Pochonia chlamydosporia 170]
MKKRLKSPELYTIGWIAALPIERAAATAVLDERHEPPEDFEQNQSDTNSYTWGRIENHNVVIASLPAASHGLAPAATTTSNLLSSLPQIRIGLLVGTGGAVARPKQDRDIRLGDVVVGQPHGMTGGVIQYDMGKAGSQGVWERTGSLNRPPPVLLSALASLQAEHEFTPSRIPELLQSMWMANPQMQKAKNNQSSYMYQGTNYDRLFESAYDHVGQDNCVECDSTREVKREPRDTNDPEIHYGIIMSGNTLVKDAATRDRIADEVGTACLCFEMEAAGLMNSFPCLVIRGICDYADSHKNDLWQRYASATAAAFAKELLDFVPITQLQATQRAIDVFKTTLDRLPVVSGASFDDYAEEHSPFCLPNTRVELRQHILSWAESPVAKTIFWLNGMAGTGKSTISKTIARSLSEKGQLGACFFFKRDQADRRSMAKFFPTLAAHLAQRIPAVAAYIEDALDDNGAVLRKTLREQFDTLILEPLSKIPPDLKKDVVVFVIDALDECERDEDIRLLIHLLSRTKLMESAGLRVFATSRPDLPIRIGFKQIEGTYQDVVLHTMPHAIVEHDISAYIGHQLAKIKMDYNALVRLDRQLPLSWPSRSTVKSLVKMAVPLFIFASTMCRFIGDLKHGDPRCQLKDVLRFQSRGGVSQLHATYMPVLNKLIPQTPDARREEILKDFKDIVGTIVILSDPLSISTLAHMLRIQQDKIDNMLDHLHSVLNVPPSAELPVRLLHLSFRDFLTDDDQRGKSPFWIDKEQAHYVMAVNCLRIMGDLQQDICSVKDPGTYRSAIKAQNIKSSIPQALRYAILYWPFHLDGAKNHAPSCDQVYAFLTDHFLHWIEALSLIGKANESINLINFLRSYSTSQHHKELSDFLEDGRRLILANLPAIDATPLQLYSSLLLFTPKNCIVRKVFQNKVPRGISLEPPDTSWGPRLQALEGHTGHVAAVAFSHNSELVASGSYDRTTRVWCTYTGECRQIFEGHEGKIFAVAFSHDSELIASASGDQTVRIGDTCTGETKHVLRGHNAIVRAVAFSHDSELVASGSRDGVICLWNTDTGECRQTLNGHGAQVNSVAFSHNSNLIASASNEKTIHIWYTDTGKRKQTLAGHFDFVTTVAFSNNSELLISGSDDKTIRVWHTSTGKIKQVFTGHRDSILAATFAQNSELVVSGSFDGTLRIWHLATGECKQTFGDSHSTSSLAISHDAEMAASSSGTIVQIWRANSAEVEQMPERIGDSIITVALSHDSKLVASGSRDGTVQLWFSSNDKRTFEGHTGEVNEVTFSHNSELLASASGDGTMRIWYTNTGQCKHLLKCSSTLVYSVAFSHDSTLVACGAGDANDITVHIWHVNSGEVKHTIKGFGGGFVTSIAFSHDSRLLASSSWHGDLQIWFVDTGVCYKTITSDGAISLAFSHDSKLLASAGEANLRVWNVETGESKQSFHVGVRNLRILCLDVDNARLVTTHGMFSLRGLAAGSIRTKKSTPAIRYSISKDEGWITFDGENVLWLPVERRPYCADRSVAVSESTVVIGCGSGRVLIFGLSPRVTAVVD